MAEPISCELYNCIPSIESQNEALQNSTFTSVWSDMLEIFVRHQAQNDYGVVVLHRHLDLSPGYAMIHRLDKLQRDICRPEPLGSCEVHPLSYCCLEGRLLAYEYAAQRTPTPGVAFLRDIFGLLQTHNLEHIVAVTYVGDPDKTWIETMLEDGGGTVATQSLLDLNSFSNDYIITEWTLNNHAGTPCILARRGCKREDNAGHSRT